MKYVKITHGYYGAKEGNIIKPKCKNDEPFALPDGEADRIVALGIAEYTTVTAEKADISSDAASSEAVLEYDDTTSMSALKAIAKREGITVPFGISKSDLKDLLDEYFAAGDDELPSPKAETPII